MQPYGKLTLKNIKLKGTNSQFAFASLKNNMSNHFGLEVLDSEISNFNYALKVYKQSFSEEILFKNTSILNCENGVELSEETNDRGDYNTEYLTIDNCVFNNVKQNVVDYYRGGYDESTIGGTLLVTNSTFTNCGSKEKNKMLLISRGYRSSEFTWRILIFSNNLPEETAGRGSDLKHFGLNRAKYWKLGSTRVTHFQTTNKHCKLELQEAKSTRQIQTRIT